VIWGACGSVVCWGTILQAGRSRDGFAMRSLYFFNWPNPSSRNMTLGSTGPLTEMSTRLTTLPPSVCRLSRRCGSIHLSHTPLWAFTACYRVCFNFLPLLTVYEVNAYTEKLHEVLTYLLHVSPNVQSVDKTTGNQMLSMTDDVWVVCQPTYLCTCFCTSLRCSYAIAALSSGSFIPITRKSANKCRPMMMEITQTSFERKHFVLEKSHLLREA
jgi:hypothetical protein